MELERMEKLAALEHKIDTATEKLAWEIKLGLMDTAYEIKKIELQLQEVRDRSSNPPPVTNNQ